MDENTTPQVKKCDRHCETCNINQRTYCAAQIALYNQEEIGKIRAILDNFTFIGSGDVIVKNKIEGEEERLPSEPMAPGADE